MKTRSLPLLAAAMSAMVLLSACDSAEDRAEGHYEKAVELISAGDVDRALIELRNVFQLNGQHIEARKLYADTMLARGDLRQAFGNYTLVSEQQPSDVDSRIELARLSIEVGDWEAFERHAARAIELAPDNPEAQVLALVRDFRTAALADDGPGRDEVAQRIAAAVETRTDDLLLHRILIQHHLQDQRFSTALTFLDTAIAMAPGRADLLRTRLAVLAQLGEEDELEAQLLEMVAADPEDTQSKEALIRWYLSRDETGKAEELLRADAYAEGAAVEPRVQLVVFVRQTRGIEAAVEEIDRLLEAGRDTALLRALRAGLTFDLGDRDAAIAALEAILADPGDNPADVLRDVKVSLARMLATVGDRVGARQRVEEVLAEDSSHVAALKMRASWLIEQDNPDAAILNLRSALDQAPRDPEIMTLMASAYVRSGSRELAGEMLSLAVEASNNAPAESVRYARFLLEAESIGVAENVLIDALRLAPNNVPVLVELGRVYLASKDWARLEQVEATLRRLGTDETVAAADALRVARLQASERNDEALSLLEGMIREQGTNVGAELEIVRTHLRNGDLAAADTFIDARLAETPQNGLLRYLKAAVHAASGRPGEAEALYRDLLAENAQQEPVWRALYGIVTAQGRQEEALGVLEEALAALPEAPNLQWALAGEYERAGNIDGAIDIYEGLYERNSNSIVVANNLASLISTYRTDAESLDRAWSIARRLRGQERPEFQDTYGWIALRRGEIDEAIAHLEPAAAGLAQDPLVQFHLGMAYVRAERYEDALRQLRTAVAIAGPADSRPQFEEARAEIGRIEAQLASQSGE